MAAATVATSRYAASVEDTKDEDEKKAKAKPKLATNGRYVILSESVIWSERGGEHTETAIARPVPEKYKKPTEFIRTLYDFPKNMEATP
jgi:hypothetical protein